MTRAGATAILLLLSGCIMGQPVRDRASLPGPLPFAAVRAAPKDGQYPILLTAGFSGRMLIDAECVLVEIDPAPPMLPVFYDGTTIGRDRLGFYLRDGKSGEVFRDGDLFRGGGGFHSAEPLEEFANTRGRVPQACRDRAAPDAAVSINPGLRHR